MVNENKKEGFEKLRELIKSGAGEERLLQELDSIESAPHKMEVGSKTWVDKIMQGTGQLVYDYDMGSGKIEWLGAVKEVTGYPPDWFQRVNVEGWLRRVHPADREGLIKRVKKSQRKGKRFLTDYRLRILGGDYVFVRHSGAFIGGEEGRIVGTITDVNETKKAHNAKERSYRTVKGFIYHNRHLFNTVLTKLRLSMELMKEYGKDCSEDFKPLVNIAVEATNSLNTSVDKMKRLCEASIGEYELKKYNAYDFVEKARKKYQYKIDEWKVNFENNIQKKTKILCNKRVENIFKTYVKNAIMAVKDSKEKYVKVDYSLRRDSHLFSVTDTGIGLKEEDLERVFIPYEIPWPNQSPVKYGLSLATARVIAEEQEGRVWAESKGRNKGSTFFLSLKKNTPPSYYSKKFYGRIE